MLDRSNVILSYHKIHKITDLATITAFNPKLVIVPYDETKDLLNFGRGTAALGLDSIVMNNNLMAARSRIKISQETCKSLKYKLLESKKITAGYLFKFGSRRIIKTIFDIQKENAKEGEKNKKLRAKKRQQSY